MNATDATERNAPVLALREIRDEFCERNQRLAAIRRRLIRETEQYLNDPGNAAWSRTASGQFSSAA